MGLSLEMTRFLLTARMQGVRFDDTLTLGRQHMTPGPKRLESLLAADGLWPAGAEGEAFRAELTAAQWRFDVFSQRLGVKRLVACDASAFEGAEFVLDLNQPVGPEREQQFDVIIDGGTLEHVFNFPVAMSNVMRMLRVGGHFLCSTPANNECGHGFYQFSPELFFRVFSEADGFRVKRCLALTDGTLLARFLGVAYPYHARGRLYEVTDPAKAGERVMMMSSLPAYLMVLAEKTAHVTPFRAAPQQSDYVPQWQAGRTVTPLDAMGGGSSTEGWLRRTFSEDFCREVLPRLAGLLDPLRTWRHRRRNSFANRAWFRPVER
jgi:SAM-dependent methyltransferase